MYGKRDKVESEVSRSQSVSKGPWTLSGADKVQEQSLVSMLGDASASLLPCYVAGRADLFDEGAD